MKLNISYPANGSQKIVEIEDERKLRVYALHFLRHSPRRRLSICTRLLFYPTHNARDASE